MARSTTTRAVGVRRNRGGTTPKPSPRSVLIIGSEAVPFAKTGGLADVLGALPLALARLGWSVTVALPRYRGIAGGQPVDRFPVSVGAYTSDVGFYESPLAERVRALLIDCPDLFDRDVLLRLETGQLDHAASEIEDRHRVAHLEHEDLSALAQ